MICEDPSHPSFCTLGVFDTLIYYYTTTFQSPSFWVLGDLIPIKSKVIFPYPLCCPKVFPLIFFAYSPEITEEGEGKFFEHLQSGLYVLLKDLSVVYVLLYQV